MSIFLLVHARRLLRVLVRKTDVRCGSALFIPGDRTMEVCVTVIPHIDLSEQLTDVPKLKDNLRKRQYNIDVEKLKDVWEFYANIVKNKEKLEVLKSELADQLKELYRHKPEECKDEIEKHKTHAKIVREDLKNLKSSLWTLEENAVMQALALPNVLHPETPALEEMVTLSYKDPPAVNNVQSHLTIGERLSCVQFSSPYNYYLKNIAAIFELGIKFYFSEQLRKSGFVQFSNPDFTKSVVVEGCGVDHTDSDSVFILHHNEESKVHEDSRMHLTGGGSLLAFAAFHTRNVVMPTVFPLRYFSLGRQYKPVPETSPLGLFQVSQASVAEIFIAVKHPEELDMQLNSIVQTVTEIYKNIGYHFRVCYVPAVKLRKWESLRVSFQLFSPSLSRYVEVGNISVSDSYISKRLQFSYKEAKVQHFPRLISGTVVSVPKLLGCALEQNNGECFHLPQVVRDSIL